MSFSFSATRHGGGGFYAATSQRKMTAAAAATALKYDKEFGELEAMLLYFPEEVAVRLTYVEYELVRQVKPIEYLRYAVLDMSHHHHSHSPHHWHQRKAGAGGRAPPTSKRSMADVDENIAANSKSSSSRSSSDGNKSVHDLILRYKEVSVWIKRLIQSQMSVDNRTLIVLSAIRCAVTCWNMGNFNSSREIWLGLKLAQCFNC